MKQITHTIQYQFMLWLKVWLVGYVLALSLAGSAFAASCSGKGHPCFGDAPDYAPGICVNDVCVKTSDQNGVCTNNSAYNPKTVAPGKGIIATVVKDIQTTLKPMTKDMFDGISKDSGFTKAATAAMTLYVIIYAITFMFGMVQLTAFDFLVRLFKISVVASLINGSAFGVFSDIIIKFFNDGTDSIITEVSTIAVGGTNLGGKPFDWMDAAILQLTSVKMLVTLMAAATTGIYGLVIIILLTIAMYTFVKAMLGAMWIYIMALVLRTLLFGLAPLFLACVMFSRTKPLFDGWLNQVVNSCLQPIFLFTFFAFFVQLIKSALDQVLQTNVCWTEMAGPRGTASATHFWRFALWDCDDKVWAPFDGVWGFTGPDNAPPNHVTNKSDCGKGAPVHPLGIMLPLTIWILSDLAKRFNDIVVNIAKDIANATTSFNYNSQSFGGDKVGGGGGGARPPARGGPPPAGGGGGGGPRGIVGEMLDRARTGSPVGTRTAPGGAVTPPGPPTPPAPPGGGPPPPRRSGT